MAQIPQVVNLTRVVRQPGVNWSDFWVGERGVATVGSKVTGIPALVDNLAVVYNKSLFARAGLKPPVPDWTWAQFQSDARADQPGPQAALLVRSIAATGLAGT